MGTLYGVQRFEHHLRACSDNWKRTCYVLKLDIRGYFMHIVRQKLYDLVMDTLQRYARRKDDSGRYWEDVLDYDLLEYLMREIIFNDPTFNCEVRGSTKDWEGLPYDKSLFHVPEGRGLPIGNLTSQLFSNVYLNVLDQFVKRTLGEKYYGRYVDDFFIIGKNRKHLSLLIPQLRSFLEEELGLTLHPNKVFLQQMHKGSAFLGVFVKPYRRYLLRKIKSRISKRMAGIDRYLSGLNKEMNRDELLYISCVANSYMGYMRHMACYRFKRLLIERNASFLKIGNFQGEEQVLVPFLSGFMRSLFLLFPFLSYVLFKAVII
ncbi:MAG: RNA-directed DNA polymerase [Bacteroides sp.]|nr:RNA-directed DNA polymerase [Bacteroides sp.]